MDIFSKRKQKFNQMGHSKNLKAYLELINQLMIILIAQLDQ
jgi:hypothetical protein